MLAVYIQEKKSLKKEQPGKKIKSELTPKKLPQWEKNNSIVKKNSSEKKQLK